MNLYLFLFFFFSQKVNLFNDYFNIHCSTIINNSVAPNKYFCKTINRLSNITFDVTDIVIIIKTLNENKVHGHKSMSICMLNICDTVAIIPLSLLIFSNCYNSGNFTDIWKK